MQRAVTSFVGAARSNQEVYATGRAPCAATTASNTRAGRQVSFSPIFSSPRAGRRRVPHARGVSVTAGVSFFGKRGPPPENEPLPPSRGIRKALLSVPALELGLPKRGISDDCLGAMQRTLSGMLGLLQPDQFKIKIDCSRESLHRLLTSATMTGYTLHNVENRLMVQKSLEQSLGTLSHASPEDNITVEQPSDSDFKETPASVHKYLVSLEQKLRQLEKERDAALAPRPAPQGSAVNNALMTYLKSLEESQVAALSKPKSPEVEDAVRTLVDSLVGRLPTTRSVTKTEANHPGHNGIHDLSTPHELTTSFAVSREYLESLILWCMCMGHYARSLEHRQELQRHISLYDGADIVPLSADHSVNIHEDSSS